MDVFEFRDKLISDYARFSRSFTTIEAEDIKQAVDVAYEGGRFWPAPLIQLNPNFEQGGPIEDLTSNGVLDSECAKIFRIKSPTDPFGQSLTLYKHQAEAIEIAKRQESYVLTTGTGSGKSLSYFIPIIDDVLQRKRVRRPLHRNHGHRRLSHERALQQPTGAIGEITEPWLWQWQGACDFRPLYRAGVTGRPRTNC